LISAEKCSCALEAIDTLLLSVARHARVLTRARKACRLTLAEPVTEPAG